MPIGFSGGMMQRLSIARAMVHDPQVLFLDEPSAGLDPQTRLLLWEIVREYNQTGKTILLTTHNMEEADTLCQRLAIIDHGRVIALGTPRELKASVPGGFLLQLRFGLHSGEFLERLQKLSGVREVRVTDGVGADVYADRGGSLIPEVSPAADVCVHLRASDGGQRLHAALLQEPVVAGHHGHLHGGHGHLGRGHAGDRGVSVHARNRRSLAGTHGHFLAGGREGRCGDAAIAGRRPDGDTGGLAFAATWCRPARTSPPSVCGRSSACGSFLRDGRPGARLQYAANPYRLDVQFDCGADDFLRLHLLSMERAREVPHHAESGARQSAGVRERRLARYAG